MRTAVIIEKILSMETREYQVDIPDDMSEDEKFKLYEYTLDKVLDDPNAFRTHGSEEVIMDTFVDFDIKE